MASYSLLPALSGFRYSAVQKTLWFGQRLNIRPFKSFFSTASAFGTIELGVESLSLRVIEGELQVDELVLADGKGEKILNWRTTIRRGATAVRPIAT